MATVRHLLRVRVFQWFPISYLPGEDLQQTASCHPRGLGSVQLPFWMFLWCFKTENRKLLIFYEQIAVFWLQLK